jgi:hypothetical protein
MEQHVLNFMMGWHTLNAHPTGECDVDSAQSCTHRFFSHIHLLPGTSCSGPEFSANFHQRKG